MKLLSFLIVVCSTFVAHAQPVKVYNNLESYLSGTYIVMDSIVINKENNSSYSIRSEYLKKDKKNRGIAWSDRKINKKIETECWAVERSDSLFLNSGILMKITKQNRRKRENYQPRGFELVTFRSSKYLCFKGGLSNIPGVYRSNTTAGDVGAPAALMIALSGHVDKPQRFDYLFDIAKNKTIYFNRGVMRQYLAEASPEEDNAFIQYITQKIKVLDAGDAGK